MLAASGGYNGGFVFGKQGDPGLWENEYGDYMQGGKAFVGYKNGLQTPVPISATLPTPWFIAEVSSAPLDVTSFYQVGSNKFTFTGSSSPLPDFYLGGVGDIAGHNCDCHIAEFRYYNRRLNTADHATELSALKTKWGV